MDAFRTKVGTIEDAVDLVRGKLSQNDAFSYALEAVMGVTAGDRADAWIEANNALKVVHELMEPPHTMEYFREVNRGLRRWQREERRLEQLRELQEMNEGDRELRPERLGRLKLSLDKMLQTLRQDIKPKILHDDMSAWENMEKEQEIAGLVEVFIADMQKAQKSFMEVLKDKKFAAVRDCVEGKPPANLQKWRKLVRELIDIELPIRREFENMEAELVKACKTCDELIAATAKINPATGEGRGKAGTPPKPGNE